MVRGRDAVCSLSSLVLRAQISGLVFSRNLATAMSIVGSDFVTKSGFMFLGERLWNKVSLGHLCCGRRSGVAFAGPLASWVKAWRRPCLPCTSRAFPSLIGGRLSVARLEQVQWGQGQKGDSAQRSLAKAVLWRVFAASNTLICGVFLARDLSVASKIAGTDTFFKTVSSSTRVACEGVDHKTLARPRAFETVVHGRWAIVLSGRRALRVTQPRTERFGSRDGL